ncbi:sugar phosphate isomerase/epimerase [Treponema primitia]|uniref:sugar phosphate isomerase/epimerase family protein n=1 Tax=Treponema primitia TaxID=88058 RepID=UPI00397F4E57
MMGSIYTDKSEYAISTFTYEEIELHEALKEIARHGFTTVELWGDTVHFDPRVGIDRKLIKQWLRELGLSVHSVHSPFRNFRNISDAEEFRKFRQQLWHDTIDDCSEFAVPIMVVHGLHRKEYNYSNDQIQMVAESLGDLCEYGRNRGVMIALENLPGTPNKVNPENSKDDSNEIRCRIQDHVKNYSGLGIKYCLDIGHAVLNGADLFEEVDAAGKDLVTFHIHNNNGIKDSHDLPDHGIIDWPGLHKYIRENGYAGQFVLEVLGGSDPFLVMDKIDSLFS